MGGKAENAGYQHFLLSHSVFKRFLAEPHSSVGSVADLRTGGCWFDLRIPVFFPRTDDSHCNGIHSSLTAVICFDIGYVEEQPVAWKE